MDGFFDVGPLEGALVRLEPLGAGHFPDWSKQLGAKLLMLEATFEQWQVYRVRSRTDARNGRSRAAIAVLGAHFDGVLRAETAGYDGTIRDSATYSIPDSEWPEVRKSLEASLRR
ncbi:GNAT family N-acetyltransferase [Streptomyces sp. NPDC057302]|uniref:GNAT family N-acetyltransferase n=1 Tax=Streptomyces sp. NPDC057302 TaxID=3346094 RepID=UPI003635E3BE